LLVLVVLGALSVPLGHMTIKRLFKGVRDKREAERNAMPARTGNPELPGDRRSDGDASK